MGTMSVEEEAGGENCPNLRRGGNLRRMPESNEPTLPRVEVGRYARLAEARERGLVVSARLLPHWIKREGEVWVLWVEEPAVQEVVRELAAFETEQQSRPAERQVLPVGRVPKLSLFVAAWLLSGFFLAQQSAPKAWEERGVADAAAILAGEWWRTITALTLHGDGPHLIANLATGLLFASFLIPRLGSGLTWLLILLSGALGNALNAWGYRGEPHYSIGASTACFGALGILVGIEMVARWMEPHTRSRWQLILPIGAGLALLAFLGVGEDVKDMDVRKVDYMAHCWGFLAGLAEGAVVQGLRARERIPARGQIWAGLATITTVAIAWLLALRT
jgi:rhomboid protease GluP